MSNNRTAQPTRRNARHMFAHSVYITKAWDWLLEFIGRAAEAILVVSVLYASVKLLPVVHMPSQLDVVVFIAQFIALDVGGLSLNKLAKQARAERNEDGAIQAGRMSKALITVMIAGVVVVAIEQLFAIPGNWKLGIDTVLLIARSILAVLYGHIIHSLKTEEDGSQPPALDIDPWPMVGMAAYLQQQIEQAINTLKAEQHQTIADIQQNLLTMQNQSPTIDTQAIAENVLASLESRFTSEMKAFQANLRQQVTISSPLDETIGRLDKAEFHLRRPGESNQLPPTQQQSIQASNGFSQQDERLNNTNIEKIRSLHAVESRETQVVRMWNEDRSRSTQTIAALTGVPKSTVAYYLKPYRDQLDDNSTPSSETTA